MNSNQFVYVTYIQATPEKIWEALTRGEWTNQYFFGSEIESTWEIGSKVTYSRGGEVTDFGEVLTYEPFS
ncbi:MAG TPA: SRPBCC domain-containing protein, partial [Candidatus Angelobacter sp.]|nr:SRPBCC domain-containing protein [Candidatus Angelobacter sp.]